LDDKRRYNLQVGQRQLDKQKQQDDTKQYVLTTIDEIRSNPKLFIRSIVRDYFTTLLSDVEYSQGFSQEEVDNLKNMFDDLEVSTTVNKK